MHRFLLIGLISSALLLAVFAAPRLEKPKPGKVRVSLFIRLFIEVLTVGGAAAWVGMAAGRLYFHPVWPLYVMVLFGLLGSVIYSLYRLDYNENELLYRSCFGGNIRSDWANLRQIRRSALDKGDIIIVTGSGNMKVDPRMMVGAAEFIRAAARYAPECEIEESIRSTYGI